MRSVSKGELFMLVAVATLIALAARPVVNRVLTSMGIKPVAGVM